MTSIKPYLLLICLNITMIAVFVLQWRQRTRAKTGLSTRLKIALLVAGLAQAAGAVMQVNAIVERQAAAAAHTAAMTASHTAHIATMNEIAAIKSEVESIAQAISDGRSDSLADQQARYDRLTVLRKRLDEIRR